MPDSNRAARLTKSFSDKLSLRSLSGTEGLGDVFEYRLSLLCPDPDLDIVKALGTHMTVALDLANGRQRYFDGLVTRFSFVGMDGQLALYVAVARPWLWLLTRRRNSRIFQNKTALDIIKQIFSEQALSAVKDSTTAPDSVWRSREYCVQYNETDFAFASRLMEEEGIYYFFSHTDGHHQMVLVNTPTVHESFPDFAEFMLETEDTAARVQDDVILNWAVSTEIQTDKVVFDDYYFEQPTASLIKVEQIKKRQSSERDYEAYTYPGHYTKPADGDHYAKVRMEEHASRFERIRAEGSARGLAVGYRFKLSGAERKDQEREYLVLRSDFEITAEVGGRPGSSWLFHCTFEALGANTPYHSPRRTPWPMVPGPQTALVVGSSGQDIETDQYGRIKVQFHWDREGKKDQNSSCWIRVSHAMAGAKWGAIVIPRIGQEVVVEFLEGNPDAPLVTGVVYNASNMPPYDLDANKTRSTFKTRSTLNGSASEFNELRFEDKKGSEEIYLHAQKDFSGDVVNDYSLIVEQGNMSEEVQKGNRSVTVDKGDQTTTVKTGKRTVTIKDNDSLTVQSGNRSVTVSQGNDSLTVSSGNLTVDVSSGKVSISAAQKIELTVGSNSVVIDTSGVAISGLQFKADAQTAAKITGLTTEMTASASATVKGAIIQIN